MTDYTLLTDGLIKTKQIHDNWDKLDSVLKLGPDNLIFESMFGAIDAILDMLKTVYDDQDMWIDWYVLENHYGSKKFKAGYHDNTFNVCDIHDLIRLLQLSEGRKF